MEREYVARINRVIDHVQDHLSEDLGLERLSRVACFSPYHFHRVFRGLTGETVAGFIRRVRLERAASQLLWAPERPVTEVALDAGFRSPAAFSRAFRERFDMSPSDWRERKIGKPLRKEGNDEGRLERYFEPGAHTPKWRLTMETTRSNVEPTHADVHVEIRDLPEQTVAYVRHTGPYQGNPELFGRLFGQLAGWAGARGLLGPDARFLSLYHDDPGVTDDDKLRVMCCCVVPDDTEVEGEIGKTKVPGGRYAVARFELDHGGYGDAWQALYGRWLPRSGYQPDDRPAIEVYLNDPESHPEGKHIVELHVPVKPL